VQGEIQIGADEAKNKNDNAPVKEAIDQQALRVVVNAESHANDNKRLNYAVSHVLQKPAPGIFIYSIQVAGHIAVTIIQNYENLVKNNTDECIPIIAEDKQHAGSHGEGIRNQGYNVWAYASHEKQFGKVNRYWTMYECGELKNTNISTGLLSTSAANLPEFFQRYITPHR